ncbi:MAG: peptidoglycan-binding protein [Cyclobacteriaceae bacterium]|nr:peptidoglycan-binding protein [Cyclobacteriaceae bacterium HetDA_MAG_MS6]
MKKLFIGIIIIALPVMAYFQYQNWKRFHPPVSYEYTLNPGVDTDYYNPEIVKEYYENAVEIGAFARSQWSNNDIDVRYPDASSTEAVNAATYYNHLIARTKMIEWKLLQSSTYKKDMQISNEDVQLLEAGQSMSMVKAIKDKASYIGLTIGASGTFVWKLQKKLLEKGFTHPVDGVFGAETLTSLTSFQQGQDIFPSGLLDEDTFERLFQ